MSIPPPPDPYRGYAQPAPHPQPPQLQGNPAMGVPNPYAAPPAYPPTNPYSQGPGYTRPDSPAGASIDRVAGILILLAGLITGGWRLAATYGFHWTDALFAIMIIVAIGASVAVLTGAGARTPALRALATVGAGMLLTTTSFELVSRLELSFLFEDQGWLLIPATIAALAATITVVLAANSTRAPAAPLAQFPAQWQYPTSGSPQPPVNPYPPQNPWPPQ
ncbi:hypothetical protein [Nocardia sp. NBC_01009]|uniref:hypothetical protein n=1 Tax=Nocardia sp. NBC_01009 TaxID=2975996 RepID=UPI003863D76D|nr:hypothetical protein OHA42_02885 [Nocardia sp. NBC_01009]